MNNKRRIFNLVPILMSTMLAALFVFSGILGELPIVGSELGVGEVYADTIDVTIDGLKYTVDKTSKTATVKKYDSIPAGGALTIPSTINHDGTNYTVTSIGGGAFENCTSITSVTIPGTVEAVNNIAFRGCRALKSAIIMDGVKNIGWFAFSDCDSLEYVRIPSMDTDIGFQAFDNCNALKNIEIPYDFNKLLFSRTNSMIYPKNGDAYIIGLNGPATGTFTYHYPLWLGDTQVKSTNRDNILNAKIGRKPTASFDPETKTLTLNRPNITTEHNGAVIYSSESLTLKGKASITGSNRGIAIYSTGEGELNTLTVVDGADLEINSGNESIYAERANVHITGGELVARSNYRAVNVKHKGNFIMDGGEVSLWAKNIALISWKGGDSYTHYEGEHCIYINGGYIDAHSHEDYQPFYAGGQIVYADNYRAYKSDDGSELILGNGNHAFVDSSGTTVKMTTISIEPKHPEKYEVWVQGIQVDETNMNDVLNDGGTVKFTPATDSATAKLTLNNANIKGKQNLRWEDNRYGIYYCIPLELELRGRNRINCEDTTIVQYSAGICGGSNSYGDRSLKISGDGSLDITGGDAIESSHGIYGFSINVYGGTITATAGRAKSSYGICALNTFFYGGMLTAAGNSASVRSTGLSSEILEIWGGKLVAVADAANESYGIDLEYKPSIYAGIVEATGETKGFGNNPNLSGYENPHVWVNCNATSKNPDKWDRQEDLGGYYSNFKYVKIAPVAHKLTIHWSAIDGVDIKGQPPVVIEGIAEGTTVAQAMENAGYRTSPVFEKTGYISSRWYTFSPFNEYKSAREVHMDLAEAAIINKDMDIYYHMMKTIDKVSVSVEPPICGTETTTEKDDNDNWDYITQTNKPKGRVVYGSHFTIKNVLNQWIKDLKTPYIGKLLGDKEYDFIVMLDSDWGYFFASNVVVEVAGSKPLDMTNYDNVLAARGIVRPVHNWDAGTVTTPATTSATGVKTFKCKHCAATKTETIPKLSPAPTPTTPVDPTKQLGEGGSAIGKGASIEAANKAITSSSSEEGPTGSKFAPLQLTSKKPGKTNIKLSWKKPAGATKFVIYGNACGKKIKLKKIATVKGTSYNAKKVAGKTVKKGTYYKFMVVALDKNNKVVSTSKVLHVATAGGKVKNYTGVTVTSKVVSSAAKMKVGKTLKLGAKLKGSNVNKHRGLCYETSNAKVATVSSKGVIKAKGKGSCKIYIYTQNGLVKIIKVTVK